MGRPVCRVTLACQLLVIVTFGLVIVQQALFALGTLNDDSEGAFAVSGMVGIPIAMLVVAAFIVACVRSCDPAEPVLAPVAAESQAR